MFNLEFISLTYNMHGINVGIICLVYLTSVWMLRAQAETMVSAGSKFRPVSQKPPIDTVIETLPEIVMYPLCLAQCNKLESCKAMMYKEGVGCTLYNRSSLTEPLAPGEEAASSTNENSVYRQDPPYVFENLVRVTGMAGSSCSQHSINMATQTCDKATDDDPAGVTSTNGDLNTNKWYNFNFPEHSIHMIHFRQICDQYRRCAELQLTIGGSIFTMHHDCSEETCGSDPQVYDKFYIPGGSTKASSLRVVCKVPCVLSGTNWGFHQVRAFAIRKG